MEMKRIDFIQDFQSVSNCKIICKNSETITTHKIILAISGDFLRDLIKGIPVADEVTLYMPEFETSEVLAILDPITLMKSESFLPIPKLETVQIKEETEVVLDGETDMEEEEDGEGEEMSYQRSGYNEDFREKKIKKKIKTKVTIEIFSRIE